MVRTCAIQGGRRFSPRRGAVEARLREMSSPVSSRGCRGFRYESAKERMPHTPAATHMAGWAPVSTFTTHPASPRTMPRAWPATTTRPPARKTRTLRRKSSWSRRCAMTRSPVSDGQDAGGHRGADEQDGDAVVREQGLEGTGGINPGDAAGHVDGGSGGGEAPSVEAKMRTATQAVVGGAPAPTSDATATGPMAAIVALAVSGMATPTTRTPTMSAMIHRGASTPASRSVSCSGSPSSPSTLEAEKAATMVTPMTPNWGAASPSTRHHSLPPRGRWRRPRTRTVAISRTGIQVMRLIASDILAPTQSVRAPPDGPRVMSSGTRMPTKRNRLVQPAFRLARRGIRSARSMGWMPWRRTIT